MGNADLSAYLEPLKAFSLHIRKNIFNVQSESMDPDLVEKFGQLGIDELFSSGFLHNTLMQPEYIFQIILALSQADAEIALALLSFFPRSILESHLKQKLPACQLYPYRQCFLVHDEGDSDLALFVERGSSGVSIKSGFPEKTRKQTIGLRRLSINNSDKILDKEVIVNCTRTIYTNFLIELSLYYNIIFLGMFKATINYAYEYSQQRFTFGKPILKHQAISQKIANMAIAYESMYEFLKFRVIEKNIQIGEMSAYNKYVFEQADMVFEESVQVLGGHGYLRDHPVEKWMRDAQMLKIILKNLMEQINDSNLPE